MIARKKPIEVEVFKLPDKFDLNEGQAPKWFEDAWLSGSINADDIPKETGYGCYLVNIEIETLEGTMTASPGDYIIKGVKGEIYPCKPDIFEMSYDIVEEPTN